MNVELKQSVETLCKALSDDKTEGSYYYSWQSNIAMSFYDAVRSHLDKKNNGNLFDESFGDGALHEVSNNAAKNFLDMLCRPLTQTIPSGSNTVQNTEEK